MLLMIYGPVLIFALLATFFAVLAVNYICKGKIRRSIKSIIFFPSLLITLVTPFVYWTSLNRSAHSKFMALCDQISYELVSEVPKDMVAMQKKVIGCTEVQ